MRTFNNSKEDQIKIQALKKISNFRWVGNTIHSDLESCLTAINLQSQNSGHYKPNALRIDGLSGYYMINQDGSLFCEARVIKEDEKKYKIEYMTMQGWNEFESYYLELLNQSN